MGSFLKMEVFSVSEKTLACYKRDVKPCINKQTNKSLSPSLGFGTNILNNLVMVSKSIPSLLSVIDNFRSNEDINTKIAPNGSLGTEYDKSIEFFKVSSNKTTT